MTARLRWALTKALWLTAGCAFLLGTYMQAMPRFF